MQRVNVVTATTDEYLGRTTEFAGWFDLDTAERFDEDTEWNGNNHISVNTGSQWNHETLYRTAGGRWVMYRSSNYQGTLPTFEFVDDDAAKRWLLLNREDETAAKYFGEIPAESGPELGRPAIGAPVQVRLPDELKEALDTLASDRGTTRAEIIRQLLADSLDRALHTAS